MRIFKGLNLCWNEKLNKVNVYSDSMEALSLINHNYSGSHPLSDMSRKIRELTMRDWVVTFDHVYREANSCVDLLAHRSWENFNVMILHEPPDDCRSLFALDMTRS